MRRPDSFSPFFCQDVDGRLSTAKLMRKRLAQLKADCGSDSLQKDMFCERACFLSIQIESMEAKAAEGVEIDQGAYVQACNALSGLFSKLGIEKVTTGGKQAIRLRVKS